MNSLEFEERISLLLKVMETDDLAKQMYTLMGHDAVGYSDWLYYNPDFIEEESGECLYSIVQI